MKGQSMYIDPQKIGQYPNKAVEPGTPVEDVKPVDTRRDTREKLEADVRKFVTDRTLYIRPSIVFGWLDRQAAITTAYCTSEDESCCEACRAAQKRKIAELTAERDELKAKLESIQNAKYYKQATKNERESIQNAEYYDLPNNPFAEDEQDTREKLLAKVDELNAHWRKSNDGWAEANAEAERLQHVVKTQAESFARIERELKQAQDERDNLERECGKLRDRLSEIQRLATF